MKLPLNGLRPYSSYIATLSYYGISVFANAIISFGVFSVLTHYLSQSDYGIINLYTATTSFLIPFIAVGVQYIIGIDFFSLSKPEFKRHFTNAIMVPLLSCLAFTLLFLLLRRPLEHLVKVNDLFLITIPFACLAAVLADLMLTLFRNGGHHFLFAGFSMSKAIIEGTAVLLLVVCFHLGWRGRLGGSIISLILAVVAVIIFIRRLDYFRLPVERRRVAGAFVMGLPFIPERLAIFVLSGSDRFFIEHFSGIAQVGLYGVGAQIAIIINLGISILSSTFYPHFYRNLQPGKENYAAVRNNTYAYIILSGLLSGAAIIATPFFFRHFIGSHFQDGRVYAVNLVIGMFFWAVYNAFLPYLLILKKNSLVMGISIAGMVLSLGLNFANVQRYGAIGATYTNVAVYVFMAGSTFFFITRYYPLRKIFRKANHDDPDLLSL